MVGTGERSRPDGLRGRAPLDLTSSEAIDSERRRRWLLALLVPVVGIMSVLAVLSALGLTDDSAIIQALLAAALTVAWVLVWRGRERYGYTVAAIAVTAALVFRPLMTGNARDSFLFLGAAGFFFLILAPRRWWGAVIAGSVAVTAVLLLGTSEAATPALGWANLAFNGTVVSILALVLGTLALRGIHGVLLGAYESRDRSAELTLELERARADLEKDVDARTTHLRRVLGESDALVAELDAQTLRDHLTGLPNRRYLERELRRRIAGTGPQSPLTVILIDLVNFKLVNDRYSHDLGDQVLAAAATRLAGAMTGDDTICRFGGDEFVVLCRTSQPADIAGTVTRMEHALAGATAPELGITLGLAYGTASRSEVPAADAEAEASQLLREAAADLHRRRGTGPRRPR